MTTTVTNDVDDGPPKPEPIRIYINPRFYQLPGAAMLVGTTIGLVRGARRASLRFLAENAHRPPTTLRGWYFYKKTKNYRMMLGGLQEGGKDASKLGITAMGWVGAEEALKRVGWEDASEVGAGLFTAGTFSAVYRLPWKTTKRTLMLGIMIGGAMRLLRWVQGNLEEQVRNKLAAVSVRDNEEDDDRGVVDKEES